MTKKYTGKDVQVVDVDVDRIRLKPSMYIGDLGEKNRDGVFNIMREVFDNSVDEHIAGRNDYIHIVYDPKDGRITVLDQGHGIPTEEKKVGAKKMSTLTAVLTVLHAGGKFKEGAYDKSRGTHGVGITATNALSSELQVWSCYKKKCVTQTFKAGVPTSKVKPANKPKFGKGNVKMSSGTAISFIPDPKIFKKGTLSTASVKHLCDQTAFMNPKLVIYFTVVGKGTKKFRHKGGLGDFLAHRIAELKCNTLGKPCVITTKNWNVAFQFTDYDDVAFGGYTNSLPQKDGGAHVDLFSTCLFKVLHGFAGARDKKKFTAKDLQDGLVGLIDMKLSHPAFNNQAKEKLVDPRVKGEAESLMKALTAYFSKYKSMTKEIIKRACELKALKDEQLKDKRAVKALKGNARGSKLPPPNKFTASKAKPEQRELYLVEGDSAGGTAKYARFPHQEILKLRGKILNVIKDAKKNPFESNEVLNILLAIGYDPSRKDPFEKLRVGRIVLLADPDPDGYHINTLVLALMVRFLRPLFERGMVYTATVKEYFAKHEGKLLFGDTAADVIKQAKGKRVTVTHIKGWGEVDSDVLRELAMDSKTRSLIRLKPMSTDDVKRFTLLMAEDTDYRRKLLRIDI